MPRPDAGADKIKALEQRSLARMSPLVLSSFSLSPAPLFPSSFPPFLFRILIV